jgi:hypothetical protein
MSDKPTILVSAPLSWSVRNVLRSGLYDRLAEQYRVVLGVTSEGKQSLIELAFKPEELWELPLAHENRTHYALYSLLKQAHAERHSLDADQILQAWANRNARPRARLRDRLFRLIARAGGEAALETIRHRERAAFQRCVPSAVRDFVERERPVLALSTCYVVNWEWPVFRSLQSLGVPTATHVLSFDNLTSRGYLPIECFDHYMVWNETMRGELERLYGVPPERITITGTPQFDFHVNDSCIWSRQRTSHVLGLDPNRPYVAYCANHQALTPSEPDLVAAVLRSMQSDPELRDQQWLIRLHPMDDYSRWSAVQRRFSNVVVSEPWRPGTSGARSWAVPSLDDVALLGNTLRYASATLHIGSTIALDSAVVDTPVISVCFHPSASAVEAKFYRDVHYTRHYAPITRSGATVMATDLTTLRSALLDAILQRPALARARAALVSRICGPVDGGSVERIERVLTELRDDEHTEFEPGDSVHGSCSSGVPTSSNSVDLA